MATQRSFQDMLNEVVKSPNESRSRKFLKLVKAGMSEAEANNVLDQVAMFENKEESQDDIFLDTKDAVDKKRVGQSNRTTSTAPKIKQGKSKLSKKLKL